MGAPGGDCDLGDYVVPLAPLAEALASHRPRRVVIQMPDGLKQYSLRLYSCVKRLLGGATIYIQADHSYGACDLQLGELAYTIAPDLVIHVGHSPYPPELYGGSMPGPRAPRVVYLAAYSKLRPSRALVEEAAGLLRSRGARRVCLVTTAQHANTVGLVRDYLESMGFRVVLPRGLEPYFSEGQVLGCDYRLALPHRGVDAFLYYGGGVFHPLGLYLATLKPVVKLDPYESRAVDLTGEGERLLRRRLYAVSRAMTARRWGVIVGLKTGQYRPHIVSKLVGLMESRGLEYVLIASENLDLETLVSIDNEWYQAFVVTSCPRLPTDDLWEYEKPVLTPGEAVMALTGDLSRYRFPW